MQRNYRKKEKRLVLTSIFVLRSTNKIHFFGMKELAHLLAGVMKKHGQNVKVNSSISIEPIKVCEMVSTVTLKMKRIMLKKKRIYIIIQVRIVKQRNK